MLVLIVINNRQNQVKIPKNKFNSYQRFDSSVSQVLVEPVFVGLNRKEKPFKVSATKATRYKESSDTFYLENPVGEISFGKDKYFLSGKDGIYEKDIQKLKINGNVEFKNQNDMSFSTTEVFFDFKDQILFGDKTVHGIKNNSTITSQGIKVYNKENKIIFTGKTKLLLANEK